MHRFLVVDDHGIVRKGIIALLRDAFPCAEVSEAADEKTLHELLGCGTYDLLILDIGLPGKTGLETLENVKREFPALPVLVFSMYSESDFGPLCLKAGASGFVSKGNDPTELIDAAETILAGNAYIGPVLSTRIARMVSKQKAIDPYESLSFRESQVFTFIVHGKSLKEIAADLAISVKTAGTYRSRVLGKMGMRTNAELIRYALERNLHTS